MSTADLRSGVDSATARMLLDQAREARRNAYAPYSNFPVGAALLATDGRVFTGCNVENASYSVCRCAEQVAIGNAVSQGVRTFTAVAVIGPGDDVRCAPCGACRQVLYEFGPDMLVIMPVRGAEQPHIEVLRDMLPGAFDASELDRRTPRG